MKKKGELKTGLLVVLTTFVLLFSSIVVISANEVEENEGIKIIKKAAQPISESMEITKTLTLERNENEFFALDIPIADAPQDEYYPAISSGTGGILGMAYTIQSDFFTAIVPWFWSSDNGNTWQGGLVWGSDEFKTAPSISFAGVDNYFVGSLQDPINDDGSRQYLMNMPDITDNTTWEATYWTWSDNYPYKDRGIPDIAGYRGLNIEWWNHVTLCIGTRDERVNMPMFNYMNYEEEGSGWSSYHDAFQGCENSAIDIDQTNGYFYGVVDHFNETKGEWDLVIIPGDCHPTEDFYLNYFDYETLGGSKNTQSPDVGAHGGNVMIVAEQDELIPGKTDIVCYHSSDNGQTWAMSIAAGNSAEFESNPTIVVYGESATCTYEMNNNLYVTHTLDGGVTWTEPEKINDQEGSLESSRHYTAITNGGHTLWTDNRNGNLDIFYENVGFPPTPIIEISEVTGGFGVSATVSNVGGAEAENLQWSINLEGGLIILGSKEGTITTLAAGESETIKLPLVLGFGASSIVVEVGGISQQTDCNVFLFFVLGVT